MILSFIGVSVDELRLRAVRLVYRRVNTTRISGLSPSELESESV